MQFNFNNKIWNDNNKEKEKIITEGFKAFFRHNEQKQINIENMYKSMGLLINTIINLPNINNLQIPNVPYSRARDLNGFSQQEIMKSIKAENYKETELNLNKLLENTYKTEGKEILLHRTSKTFFKKRRKILKALETFECCR